MTDINKVIDDWKRTEWCSNVGRSPMIDGVRQSSISEWGGAAHNDWQAFRNRWQTDYERELEQLYIDNAALNEWNEIGSLGRSVFAWTEDFLEYLDEEHAVREGEHEGYYPGTFSYPHEIIEALNPARDFGYRLLEINAAKYGWKENINERFVSVWCEGHILVSVSREGLITLW